MDTQLLLAAVLLATLLLAGSAFLRERRARIAAEAFIRPASEPGDGTPARPSLFTTLATALDDGVLVVEPDRRISFANDSAGLLLGRHGAKMRGQTVMVGLRDYDADQAVERALASGERQSVMLHTPRSGRTLQLTCQPVAN